MKGFAIFVAVVVVVAVALASAHPVHIETAKTNDAAKAEARKAPETPGIVVNVRDKRTLFGGLGGGFRTPFAGDTVPLGGYSSYSSVFNTPYAAPTAFWVPPTYFLPL